MERAWPAGIRTMASRLTRLGAFLRYLVNRFLDDRCLEFAASLTFATLLAFVPMMAITLSILAQFPIFDEIRAHLHSFVLGSFLPETGAMVLDQLGRFTHNTGKLSAFGAVGLTLAVFMLLLAVESAFNSIWHVTVPRPFMWRLLAFWTLLTLGPILLGMSLTLSGYLFATARAGGLEAWTGPGGQSTRLLPPLIEFAAFALLYGTIPNRPVKARHAFVGAVAATVLFEALKKGFGLYVTIFPTYQTIYGAMAAIPITMIWVYVAWSVGLLGAEIAASLGEWSAHPAMTGTPPLAPGMRLTVALSVLAELRAASLRGAIVERKDLLRTLNLSAFVVETVLGQLAAARYVNQAGRDRWVLGRDLEDITLYDLYASLDLGVDTESLQWMAPSQWKERAADSIATFDSLSRECMGVRLKELFAAQDNGCCEVIPINRKKR